MKVAFIGLGIMGQGMAANLAKAGIDVTVYNRSKTIYETLEKQGAKTANSLKEAVQDADVVFTMLSTPEVVKNVAWEGEESFVQYMKKGALWLDCATVNPSFSLETATQAKIAGIRFIDAPVAGTKPHAANGQLTFFLGGEASDLEEVRSLLEHMGQKILHLGRHGQGSNFKMLVNGMLAQSMLVFSEAVILGQKMGFDRDFLLNVLSGLPVSAAFTKVKAEGIKANDYEVQFPLEWMLKDLHLLTTTAYEQNQSMFLANISKEIFTQAKASGLGRLDFSAVHQYLEEQAK